MNIGIRLHDTAPGTLPERLGFAKAQGFSCAHLAMSKVINGFSMQDAPKLLTEELAAEVRAAFSENRMECAVLGCYLNLANPDEEARAKTQEIYKAHLRFGRMIGAGVVGSETYALKETRFSDGPAPQSEEAFQLFMKGFLPVARYAEEAGEIMTIEPVCTHIISNPERAERMLDTVKSDHVKIILDAVNLISNNTADQAESIIREAVRRLGDQVRVLHMKDFAVNPDKPGGEQVDFRPCGMGTMYYGDLLPFAKKNNLPMTLEDTKPDNAQAAREYLEQLAMRI
ncbi:MAG: sugar phosphate isomerase/epimerase [Clostridia bacterium]|nr:sugar phosphate isomerase/epimerase [Clostridia bacterium]